jgi:glutathione S-transferase
VRIYSREGAGRPPRVAWALEEAGAEYEVVRLTPEQTHGEEHRRRHPLERVPVLEDDEGALFESAGLCLHVADLHPQAGLIAAAGTRERALTYQWSLFAMTELEPAIVEASRNRESDPQRSQAALERFRRGAAAVDDALGENEYLIADRFSIADVVVSSVLAISRRFEEEELLAPRAAAYLARMEQRPARVRAYAALA